MKENDTPGRLISFVLSMAAVAALFMAFGAWAFGELGPAEREIIGLVSARWFVTQPTTALVRLEPIAVDGKRDSSSGNRMRSPVPRATPSGPRK